MLWFIENANLTFCKNVMYLQSTFRVTPKIKIDFSKNFQNLFCISRLFENYWNVKSTNYIHLSIRKDTVEGNLTVLKGDDRHKKK